MLLDLRRFVDAGQALVVTAGSGAYDTTGAAVALVDSVPADFGVFALTGSDAGLYAGYLGTAGTTSYDLTGSDAGVLATRLLAVDLGAYSDTGADAGVLAGYVVGTSSGSCDLTGTDAGLAHGFLLSIDAGSYDYAGTDDHFVHSVPVPPGEYQLTGSDVDLVQGVAASFSIVGVSGFLGVVGFDLELVPAFLAAAESGDYQIVGADVSTDTQPAVQAVAGSYGVIGVDARLRRPGDARDSIIPIRRRRR